MSKNKIENVDCPFKLEEHIPCVEERGGGGGKRIFRQPQALHHENHRNESYRRNRVRG